MELVCLKDLVEIEITDGTHKTPVYADTGYIFLSSKNVTSGKIDWDNVMYIPEDLHNELYKRVKPQKNDILLAKNGTTGVGAIVDKDEIFDIYVSLALIRPNTNNVLPKYLLYAINSESTKRFFDSNLKGIGVPNLHLTHIRETPIKLFDFAKQEKIVKELDSIEKVIKWYKELLTICDETVKARFVELFGDPAGNPKKWNTLSFREAGNRLSDGPFGSNLKSEHYTTSGVRVIRLGNVGVGQFIDNDKSYISEEHYEKLKKYTCKAGEIVIGTLGEPNLRACLVPKNIEYAVNKADCVHYIPNAEILNTKFVCQYINCPETLLLASGMVHGQTRSRISSGQLAEIPIFVPPLELQNQFATFVEQTDKSKMEIQKSLEKLECLKKALMQKYFG